MSLVAWLVFGLKWRIEPLLLFPPLLFFSSFFYIGSEDVESPFFE